MIRGFDDNSPLVCEGIIGDGCGGGRFFLIKDETLFAYDPQSKESITLLQDIKCVEKVTKNGCIITVKCAKEVIKFNLSTFKQY